MWLGYLHLCNYKSHVPKSFTLIIRLHGFYTYRLPSLYLRGICGKVKMKLNIKTTGHEGKLIERLGPVTLKATHN